LDTRSLSSGHSLGKKSIRGLRGSSKSVDGGGVKKRNCLEGRWSGSTRCRRGSKPPLCRRGRERERAAGHLHHDGFWGGEGGHTRVRELPTVRWKRGNRDGYLRKSEEISTVADSRGKRRPGWRSVAWLFRQRE